MASMTAKAYLTKINEICEMESAAGQCKSTGASSESCPLWQFGCGTPTDKNKINDVIDVVKNYQAIEPNKCPGCGRDKIALNELQDIKFCPYCGASLSKEKRRESNE